MNNLYCVGCKKNFINTPNSIPLRKKQLQTHSPNQISQHQQQHNHEPFLPANEFSSDFMFLNYANPSTTIQDKYASYQMGMGAPIGSNNLYMTSCGTNSCQSIPLMDNQYQQRFIDNVIMNTEMPQRPVGAGPMTQDDIERLIQQQIKPQKTKFKSQKKNKKMKSGHSLIKRPDFIDIIVMLILFITTMYFY